MSLMFCIMDIMGIAGQKPGPPQSQEISSNGAMSPRSRKSAKAPERQVTGLGGLPASFAGAHNMITSKIEWWVCGGVCRANSLTKQ